MSSEHSGYFPLRWNSGVKETMSKNSEEPSTEASPMRCKSRRAFESGPEALLELIIMIRLRRSVLSGADDQEHATPILSLCHGIFTD